MLNLNIQERLNIEDVLLHPFLKWYYLIFMSFNTFYIIENNKFGNDNHHFLVNDSAL